jgi:hypothetical protein
MIIGYLTEFPRENKGMDNGNRKSGIENGELRSQG